MSAAEDEHWEMEALDTTRHIARSRWGEFAIRTIDSYMARTCYFCMDESEDAAPAYRMRLDGDAIAVCAACWWQWFVGAWADIGAAYLNATLDAVRDAMHGGGDL